jgi:thymidylate synthase ThyX
MTDVTLVREPTILVLAEMHFDRPGLDDLVRWVRRYRPECIDDEGDVLKKLMPHGGLAPDGSPLTDNEMLVELAGRKCCDASTEVLTRAGWVRFPDLKRGMAVGTYSIDRDAIEFQVPTDYIEKEHTGRMYTVSSRAISLRVTDDHDLFVQDRAWDTVSPWRFADAASMAGRRYRVRRCAPYEGGAETDRRIPEVVRGSEADWAEFLGYYISEGSIGGGADYGTGKHIRIYQRPEGIEPIRACVERLGLNPRKWEDPRNGVQAVVIHNTELADALLEFGRGSWGRRIPPYAFDWPRGIRGRLLDALMYGDGHLAPGGQRIYNTCSPDLAEDVQRLILLSGRPASISRICHNQLTVREGTQAIVTVNNKAKHDGFEDVVREPVYCVTVPNRVLVVRRDGKICMISNCYNSFGLKAGKKENADYIANTQQGDIPHASIMYHAKMSFFIGDVSRRVSHELIRNYVGADRDEEGNPSQESTRYTHHPGHFIVHPRTEAGGAESVEQFRQDMQSAYDAYLRYISREVEAYRAQHGKDPQQIDRKRIYECAADRLPMACATSWIWTTNPIALAKLFRERANEHADLEFQRFAYKWKALCLRRWPNLFCQPWMRG